MDTKTLLLEIGTEEIPAHAMPAILNQLKDLAQKNLTDARINFGEVQTLGTPRRLALIVSDVAANQANVETEKKGPSTKIAFDKDGKPSKAAVGFARGQKVAPEDLITRDGYVYAVIREQGKPSAEIFKTLLPKLICDLSFPNNMRWRDLDFRFIRPLRWIVALYDAEVVPFEVAEVKSGKTSRGHRFLSQGDFTIESAAAYEKACEENFVIVDQEKRKAMIREQIAEVAKKNGGKAEITEDLLEEVLYLVEYPTALCGKFEEKYLQLPPETVITPMRDHQRYFPVKDANGKLSITAEGSYILTGTLTDGFVYVSVADNAKVQLILNGVNISCSTGSAIYIENADKTSITLASGTTNTVSDGSAYTDGNACIYSKDDLTINGSGSLTVTANCNNGIGCKNDLKIVSGTLTVTAVANGLKGNDSVGIFGGTITVTAGKDGIKADTDDDTTKGFVYIAGGTVKVTASDDGIQAVTAIALVGGSVSISAEDSQLNCDGTIYKADGVLK